MIKRITLAALVLTSIPLAAQTRPAADSAAVRGYEDGRRAAEKESVGGRAVASLGGGVLFGFFAPIGFFGSNPVGMIGAGLGGGAIIAAAESGSAAPPDSLVALGSTRSASYAPAFARGYSDRLKSRRRSASFIAGGVGTAGGFGILIVLVAAAFGSD